MGARRTRARVPGKFYFHSRAPSKKSITLELDPSLTEKNIELPMLFLLTTAHSFNISNMTPPLLTTNTTNTDTNTPPAPTTLLSVVPSIAF